YLRGGIVIGNVKLNLGILEGVCDEKVWVGGGSMKANEKMGQGNYGLGGEYVEGGKVLLCGLDRVEVGE
ncbi:sortase family protein, partial [Staphylococcus epidermidis]